MDKQIKERGIIFNCEMVRAILDGRKTQARRAIKSPAATLQNNGTSCIAYREAGDPWYKNYVFSMRGRSGIWNDYTLPQFLALCPFGKVGDRLWVRETFATLGNEDGHPIDWNHNLVSERKDSAKVYRASCYQKPNNYGLWTIPDRDSEFEGPWTPSSKMPRWASRITLEITDIRAERNGDQWEWVVEFKRVENTNER